MRVTVWRNVDRDHYDGYELSHPMLRVFSYTVPDGDPEDELRRAVELFNTPMQMFVGADRATAAAYRLRRLRSFSPGDGFSVLPSGATAEQFWVSDGRQLLCRNGPFLKLALEGCRGSTPLGRHVTYLIPAVDALLREGLFETAVAGRHGHHLAGPARPLRPGAANARRRPSRVPWRRP